MWVDRINLLFFLVFTNKRTTVSTFNRRFGDFRGDFRPTCLPVEVLTSVKFLRAKIGLVPKLKAFISASRHGHSLEFCSLIKAYIVAGCKGNHAFEKIFRKGPDTNGLVLSCPFSKVSTSI